MLPCTLSGTVYNHNRSFDRPAIHVSTSITVGLAGRVATIDRMASYISWSWLASIAGSQPRCTVNHEEIHMRRCDTTSLANRLIFVSS